MWNFGVRNKYVIAWLWKLNQASLTEINITWSGHGSTFLWIAFLIRKNLIQDFTPISVKRIISAVVWVLCYCGIPVSIHSKIAREVFCLNSLSWEYSCRICILSIFSVGFTKQLRQELLLLWSTFFFFFKSIYVLAVRL